MTLPSAAPMTVPATPRVERSTADDTAASAPATTWIQLTAGLLLHLRLAHCTEYGNRARRPQVWVARLGRMTRKTRAVLVGADGDLAAVAPDDDPPGDVEAEAGALAHVLGREERLEDVRPDVGRDARPGVRHLDHHALLGRPSSRAAACPHPTSRPPRCR